MRMKLQWTGIHRKGNLKNEIIHVLMNLLSGLFCGVEQQVHGWKSWGFWLRGAPIWQGRCTYPSFSFWDLPFSHYMPPWGLASPGSCTPLAKGLVFVPKWKTRPWEYKLWPVNWECLELIGYGSIPWKITAHLFLPSGCCAFPSFWELSCGRCHSLIYLVPPPHPRRTTVSKEMSAEVIFRRMEVFEEWVKLPDL